MRVLVAHPGCNFSVQDVYAGWVEGLQANGCEVARYNLDDRLNFYAQAHIKRDDEWVRALSPQGAFDLAANGLLAACMEVRPDVLLVVSCFFIPNRILDIIRSHGIKVAILHTESPYQDDEQLDRAEHADLNLLNDPTNLDLFPNAVYQPHSYRPTVHYPRPVKPECRSDFAFVGTGYPSRIDFLEAVDWTGVDVALAGNWQALAEGSPLRKFLAHDISECVDNSDAIDLYVGAKVNANLYRVEATRPELSEGWAMGPREVELAACGAFFLRQPRGEGDEVFPMLPTFTGPEEFEDRLRWWLDHPTERHGAALLAREAIADRTFTNAAADLLRRLS